MSGFPIRGAHFMSRPSRLKIGMLRLSRPKFDRARPKVLDRARPKQDKFQPCPAEKSVRTCSTKARHVSTMLGFQTT